MVTYVDVHMRGLLDVFDAFVEALRDTPGTKVTAGGSDDVSSSRWVDVEPGGLPGFMVDFYREGVTVTTDAEAQGIVLIEDVLAPLWAAVGADVLAVQGDGSFARRVRGGQSVEELEASWVEIDPGDLGVRDPLAGREG